jgi:hypothetical protein
MCPFLVRTDIESTEVDEPAVGNRICHQVLRDKKGFESGMNDTWVIGKCYSPYFCLDTAQDKYPEDSDTQNIHTQSYSPAQER